MSTNRMLQKFLRSFANKGWQSKDQSIAKNYFEVINCPRLQHHLCSGVGIEFIPQEPDCDIMHSHVVQSCKVGDVHHQFLGAS